MTKRTNILSSLTILRLGLVLGAIIAATGPRVASPVYAQSPGAGATTTNYCKAGQVYDPQKPCIPDPNELKSTPDSAAKTCTGGDCSTLITNYVNPAIRVLSGLVGVIVAISIVVAGIQYGSAGGDPSKVVAARKRIVNAVLALLAYLFMFAFLQWLLPGGIV